MQLTRISSSLINKFHCSFGTGRNLDPNSNPNVKVKFFRNPKNQVEEAQKHTGDPSQPDQKFSNMGQKSDGTYFVAIGENLEDVREEGRRQRL